jgi:hypothetical protein
MYGIGMKRAIFKMGTSAYVQSNSPDGFVRVDYTSEWLAPTNDKWELPIQRLPTKKAEKIGVGIFVTQVKPEIGKQFASESFVNELRTEISEHFGYVMQKGFAIVVNGQPVRPSTLWLFSGAPSGTADIAPFDYEAVHDSVQIKVTVGLFRGLAREAEIDEETTGAHDIEAAGITVVCNDRVIVLGDRTMRSGWGDGGVPRYHPQFRAIAGLIVFFSTNAEKLPISTTKRGLDVGSEVYLLARKAAMEGLKLFTDFTNKWKGMEEETAQYFKPENRAEVKTQIDLARTHGTPVRGEANAKKFKPSLPVPADRNPRKRISFVRGEQQIRTVSKYLFADSQHASIVGGECFDRVLSEAKSK